jgi:hypothetical protein
MRRSNSNIAMFERALPSRAKTNSPPSRYRALRISTARSESGTRCSRPPSSVRPRSSRPGVEINLGPFRADRLGGPRGREDREFESASRDARLGAKVAHERGHLEIGYGVVMLDGCDLGLRGLRFALMYSSAAALNVIAFAASSFRSVRVFRLPARGSISSSRPCQVD